MYITIFFHINNRCISNITSIELDLISNKFTKNYAINGGAIYIDKRHVDNINVNNTINIKRNIFHENLAENFGGAIYSDYDMLYLSEIMENEIKFNNARIMGGGTFLSKMVKESLSKITNIDFSNNTVNSYINNYTSKPFYITLNSTLDDSSTSITSGQHLQLEFYLYDEYDNIIEDITKYYYSINLRITIEEKDTEIFNNDDDDDKNSNYYLIGNIGSFVKGKNKLVY